MTLKDLIKEASKQSQSSATVRIYADISSEVNAGLEQLSSMTKKTKKGMLEWLINDAVSEFVGKEIETGKRARAVLKGKK